MLNGTDKGCGVVAGLSKMSAPLRLALQFGNGTHLTDRKGIGRFGMGSMLLASAIEATEQLRQLLRILWTSMICMANRKPVSTSPARLESIGQP